MRRVISALSPVFVLSVLTVVSLPARVDACTCLKQCGSILTAKALFEATVVAVEAPDASGGVRVRLGDVRAVRGATAQIVTAGRGDTCGYTFKVGTRYLIDAYEFEAGRFGVSLCSETRPLASAQALLDYLRVPSPEVRPRVFGTLSSQTADHYLRTGSASGPPIAGAVVSLAGPVSNTTITGASGQFSFVGVPDGNYRLLVEMPRDRNDVSTPSEVSITLDRMAACADVDVFAPSTARVTGLVVDPAGAPIPGVWVEIFPLPYDQWAGGIVTGAQTDADGRFAIEQLAPGLYGGGLGMPYPKAETPFVPRHARTLSGDIDLVVAPGATVELGLITARPAAPIKVSGVITGQPGADVAGLFVVAAALDGFPGARTGGATSGASGRFALDLFRGVRYGVEVESRGRVIGTAEFVAGDDAVEVRLRPRQ